ncbi:hypothetical protein QCA50_004937 [Cerrena zonata]|uniref:Protein kinase domain-containing protein n=1 Tax=Cerrena zonata TaxID=2478898 RepID=A0AAW0GDF4_9APHY
MASRGHRPTGSVSQVQNHKAQLASAYNELGKELSSQKIRVVGNYTLGKVIGEGTYGKVRMGVHRLTGMKVAIKQIPKAMSPSLTREIHHHRQLHHPNVTQLYEVIATESSIWLVTELCSGGELFDYLAEKGRLGEDEVRVLFGQLCLAVAYVHDKGIVHRDLKLENVLLDERCRVKLGDFGFTREFDKNSLLETYCGTTGYASPEMLLSKKYTGPEVDVWSLGVILYTLLTGTLPFDDDDEFMMRQKVIKGEFEDPDWLSDEARDLIKNILIIDPSNRLTIAQIFDHPWFKLTPAPVEINPLDSFVPPPSPPAITTLTSPFLAVEPQPTSSVASDATFHSASEEPFPSNPTTPDDTGAGQVDDVFQSPTSITSNSSNDVRPQTSEDTLRKLIGATSAPADLHLDVSPSRPSLSRTTTASSSKNPPQYPARTPARTKRRSVSSTLSEQMSPSSNFEKSKDSEPAQDFSTLLSTPAPLIFSTPLERDLLNSLSSLGFDTGQIVHSVLTDACDATGALWWMMKRKAEKKAIENPPVEEVVPVVTTPPEEQPAETSKGDGSSRKKEKEKKDRSIGRAAGDATKSSIPLSLAVTRSAPELQFIPPTPTAPNARPTTPPRTHSPTNPLLSPTSSSTALDPSVRSYPSTPGGSVKEKDRESNQGSKGRKNRAGSVSIMQRATTALEAAGLVRKKSNERVLQEAQEKAVDKRLISPDEPRSSHGSSSSRLAKSPPLKALKDIAIPSTPPRSTEGHTPSNSVGSPWVVTNKQSPPNTPISSPADTLGALPNIGEHGRNRNRASLLTAFRMWFKEDAKGKRKEAPHVTTDSLPSGRGSIGSPNTSPVTGRGRGSIKQRRAITVGNKRSTASHRAKRASVSSRRSSSVNSRRSSIASAVHIPMEHVPSAAGRRSFGSHTPNSDLEELASRPASMQSFHHRHRKSPSASSSGSMHYGRNSPLPKYHRRHGSSSSTRVVRQIQPSHSKGSAHLRSNSASSNHSLASSRHGSLYELSEPESRRNGSPAKRHSYSSLDDTPRRNTHGTSTFVAHKRQTPFASGGYLNSLGRSSWKKSWGLEPPGWQTRTAQPAIEILAISPPPENANGIRDVFTGRQSLNMGDESDWVDEDDDTPGYAGGLGQMHSLTSPPSSYTQITDGPLVSPPPRSGFGRSGTPSKRSGMHNSLVPAAGNGRSGRAKTGGRSPAGRSSPLPNDSSFDTPDNRNSRRQLPAGRSGPTFRQPIQEEDEDEE